MMDKFDCEHIWISNSGNGGEPKFTQKAGLGGGLLMHVKCSKCNSRTWVNEDEWEALAEVNDDE